MASSRSSSSLESEVDSCSKTCVIAYASLKEQYDNLSFNYKKSQFKLVSYKAGLESIEARQVHYNKNESMLEDSINVLKLEVIDKFKKGLGYDAATAASPVVEGQVNTARQKAVVNVVRTNRGNPETKLEDLVRLNSPKDEKRPGAELTQQNDKSQYKK
ncbi:hypothetical protein Tco_0410028 [Tanacetum coccineum]